MNTNTKKPKKISWYTGVSRWLKKVASFLRNAINLIGELISHFLDLFTFTFSVAVKVGINPVAPIICAIVLFLMVCAVTANQWWKIGIWLAQFIGVVPEAGAVAVLLFGVGINIFQLMPRLRKLDRAINRAYARMRIDLEYEPEAQQQPEELEVNWLSENHRQSKVWSALSYCAETGLVVVYVFVAAQLAMLAIVQALISLILPEATLHLASSTISLMGRVSREVAFEYPPESEVNL